ncbi:hypothetical protein [Saccharothrix obliqua]|uniref:hypothetical protein n=1 Tax=Saccharothrix obliqua TaxID=2861747 RepID=UPI001C5EB3D5|nr:hypothetical protein [Saccharothrix obliqua]MBW4720172.1 hypothetical protein [Saccharothrix obliqua]
MARWVWPTVAGVVASATGVLINLATEQVRNPWTWGGVVVLTLVGVAVGGLARPDARGGERARPDVHDGGPPAVRNSVSGTVHGGVVQASTLGSVTINSGVHVDQTATAHDGGVVYQAGRDVDLDRGRRPE